MKKALIYIWVIICIAIWPGLFISWQYPIRNNLLPVGTVKLTSEQERQFFTPIDTPRYEKFRKVTAPDNHVARVFQVFDSLMDSYGQDKLDSHIKAAKKMYNEHRNYLLSNLRMDSILVKDTVNKVKKVGK